MKEELGPNNPGNPDPVAPIFAPDEHLSAGRIRLSRLTPETLGEMQDWLTLALEPDWPEYALEAAAQQGEGVLITEAATGAEIGAAVAVLEAPRKGAAVIPFISVAPNCRYRGLGGEATLALERHLRARFELTAVYAPIPDWRGLAVYFWLRQGYRPVTTTEAPWPLAGLIGEPRPGIWMLRDTA